jgi:hypothetical protein
MEQMWEPVQKFLHTHGIVFYCLYCKKPVRAERSGEYHMVTGSHCDYCGASYQIDWKIPIEQSIVKTIPARLEMLLEDEEL